MKCLMISVKVLEIWSLHKFLRPESSALSLAPGSKKALDWSTRDLATGESIQQHAGANI